MIVYLSYYTFLNSMNSEINIYVFDGNQEIYEKIFPKEVDFLKEEFGIIQSRSYSYSSPKKQFLNLFKKNKVNGTWLGYKYPPLLQENRAKIIRYTHDQIKKSNNKNSIIIKFGNSFMKEFSVILSKLSLDKLFILFILNKNEVTNFEVFKEQKYLSYIINENNSDDKDKLYFKIISYIWEKDCYLNERGNEYCKFLPANLLYQAPKGFIYCNILLTGESRSGKSCFINRMFNRLVSYESGNLESATKEINTYELYPSNEDEEDSEKIKKGQGGIKIFDTPGLVKTKNLNSFELIKSKLDEIFCQIHIIIFFNKSQGNLENCIDMLEYINNKNEERIKKKLNKIPIIFVKNGEDLERNSNLISPFFKHIKTFFKKNKLMDLYDNSVNVKNNKKDEEKTDDEFFMEKNELNNNYENYIDGNLIQVNLLSGKNINTIFSTICEYILNYNKALLDDNNEFIQMEDNAKKLINYFIKENLKGKSLSSNEKKDLEFLYNNCNNFVEKLRNNCSLLYDLNILDVKTKFKKTLTAICLGVSIIGYLIVILSPIFIYPLIRTSELFKKACVDNVAAKFGFNEEDIIKYGLYDYIYNNGNTENYDESFINEINDKFENIIYYIGHIQCAIKSKELFNQILKTLYKLKEKNENDWIEFKPQKI